MVLRFFSWSMSIGWHLLNWEDATSGALPTSSTFVVYSIYKLLNYIHLFCSIRHLLTDNTSSILKCLYIIYQVPPWSIRSGFDLYNFMSIRLTLFLRLIGLKKWEQWIRAKLSPWLEVFKVATTRSFWLFILTTINLIFCRRSTLNTTSSSILLRSNTSWPYISAVHLHGTSFLLEHSYICPSDLDWVLQQSNNMVSFRNSYMCFGSLKLTSSTTSPKIWSSRLF